MFLFRWYGYDASICQLVISRVPHLLNFLAALEKISCPLLDVTPINAYKTPQLFLHHSGLFGSLP
jgi:hypothetical protein